VGLVVGMRPGPIASVWWCLVLARREHVRSITPKGATRTSVHRPMPLQAGGLSCAIESFALDIAQDGPKDREPAN
jgi:hypothetical protein